MSRFLIAAGLIGLIVLLPIGTAFGLDLPHAAPENVGCTSCHTLHNSLGPDLTNQPTNAALCKSCHTFTGTASSLPFADSDQARPGISGTSHSWSGLMPAVSNPANAYGLRAATDLAISELQSRVSESGNTVICSVCHDQHYQLNVPWDPFSSSTSRGQTGTATGGTVNTLTDTSQSWTVNQWANLSVKMKSGPDAGLERKVLSNTATQLILGSSFPSAVSAGNSYYLGSNRHFMRIANTADQLCLDCHYYRNQSDVATYTGTPLSHPVKRTLAAVKDPTQFFSTPREPQSAAFAPQTGARGELNGGTDTNLKNNIVLASDLSILCLSCHGMHFTPTSDGNLLRRPQEEICSACHKTDVNTTNDDNAIKTHNSSNAFSSKWGANGWGITGGKYGKFGCTTCHTGHGSKNIYLLKESLTAPNAPTDSLPGSSVDFRVLSGSAGSAGLMGDDTAGHAVSNRVCEVCHSKNSYHNYNTANNANGLDHNNGTDCTACHSHKAAFAASEPGTGSGGPVDCTGCHSKLSGPMHSTSGYHHYMNNGWTGTTQNSGVDVYPVLTPGVDVFGAGNPQSNTSRRCLICHVDHFIFRPNINTANGGRGKNLRSDVASIPTFTAPGPGTNFTNTDFDNNNTYGGLCLSCHSYVQSKGYLQADSTTKTPAISKAGYNASPHQYVANSAFKGTLASTFSANCSKCHNDTITKDFQIGASKFGLHDSNLGEMTAPMGATSPASPMEESLCYRCHSYATDITPGGGPAKTVGGKDYYGLAGMSAASESLFRLSTNYTYANTLYFREMDPSSPPSGSGSTDSFSGGTWQAKSMIPLQGSTDTYRYVTLTNTGNPCYWRMVSFVSPPVQMQTSVQAGSWTVTMHGYESYYYSNAYLRASAYVWTAGGTRGASIAPLTTRNTELDYASTANVLSIALSGSQVTLNAGDRIIVEFEIESRAATSGFTATLVWGASGEKLVMPASIPFTWLSPTSSAHYMANYSGKHKASSVDETRAYLSANKHVECSDCHNPHTTTAGTHTPRSTTLANALNGVDGVNVTSWPAAWATPTISDTLVTATEEWQVCFKCHSSYNTNLTGWNPNWTDLAQEFNPNNASYHSVIAGGHPSGYGTFLNGWSPWVRMTCSDCHFNNIAGASDAKGPHKSGLSGIVGKDCTGCHDVISGTSGFSGFDGQLHNCHYTWGCSESEMGGPMTCTTCHVKVPHGAPRPRLMVLNSDDARYKDSATPHLTSWNLNTNNYNYSDCSGYCH